VYYFLASQYTREVTVVNKATFEEKNVTQQTNNQTIAYSLYGQRIGAAAVP
jgi:hypothetical protein